MPPTFKLAVTVSEPVTVVAPLMPTVKPVMDTAPVALPIEVLFVPVVFNVSPLPRISVVLLEFPILVVPAPTKRLISVAPTTSSANGPPANVTALKPSAVVVNPVTTVNPPLI